MSEIPKHFRQFTHHLGAGAGGRVQL